MKLNEIGVVEASANVEVFKKSNRIVKAISQIPPELISDWNFHDEFHDFEYLVRKSQFSKAADIATKEYCRQKGTKFARLNVLSN